MSPGQVQRPQDTILAHDRPKGSLVLALRPLFGAKVDLADILTLGRTPADQQRIITSG